VLEDEMAGWLRTRIGKVRGKDTREPSSEQRWHISGKKDFPE